MPRGNHAAAVERAQRLGTAIRELTSGLDEGEVASAIGVRVEDLAKWEAGEDLPGLEELFQLESHCGAELGSLTLIAGYANERADSASGRGSDDEEDSDVLITYRDGSLKQALRAIKAAHELSLEASLETYESLDEDGVPTEFGCLVKIRRPAMLYRSS